MATKRTTAHKTDAEADKATFAGFRYALDLFREVISLIPSEALVRDALLETLYELATEEFADEKRGPTVSTLVWLYFRVLKRGEICE